MHLGRWDVATPAYPPGAWLRGTIHPQRCDLSPDGRWFAYFALKPGAGWEGAGVDVLRDLTPAVADGACGVGDRQHVDTGVRFVEDASVWEVDPPDLGDAGPVRERFGLQMSRADSFSVERRRGWTETADTPPRDPSDAWGRIEMEKPRPGSGGSERLTVRGTSAAIRELHGLRTDVRYELHGSGGTRVLEGIQWADWDAAPAGCSWPPTPVASRSVRSRRLAPSRGRPTTVRWSPIRGCLRPTRRGGESDRIARISM